MKAFKLSCRVTVSAYTVVRAESLEAAIDAVSAREVQLGGTGSGVEEEDSWIIDEADGAPCDIKSDE